MPPGALVAELIISVTSINLIFNLKQPTQTIVSNKLKTLHYHTTYELSDILFPAKNVKNLAKM